MKHCKVTINERSFSANYGDLLLDSAILNGVELPHDCRAGVCGTCSVRLVAGKVFGGEQSGTDIIHACQARILSDLNIMSDAAVPHRVSVSAQIVRLVRLAPDVIDISIELERPFNYLPGQYCKLQFRGFPARRYSPSYPLQGASHAQLLHFQIRRFRDGAISSALGEKIAVGHRLRLTGPFGGAFFRPNHPGGVVLVSSGTGFAPMWSIAVEAIKERPQREMVFVVATQKLQSFYMHSALCRLARFPNVTIIPIVSEPQHVSSDIRSGRPIDCLPNLSPEHVVYASGAAALTVQVAKIAKAAGAKCYADPFVSHAELAEDSKLMSRLVGWLSSPRKNKTGLQALRAASQKTSKKTRAAQNKF
jgi:3-phenylpropionate/trans-cinnamate dioxygenase ferredoxin reductase subunit